MNLLIVTQQVDADAPVLGFFHGWIAAFAERCNCVTVIGQHVGHAHLPPNVTVWSLGKEDGIPRWIQILRFWRIILRERGSYDRVFVHMTPVWVVLGWPVWALLRKPVFLWYEARGGGWALPLALCMVYGEFSATAFGLPRHSARHRIVGHGIDTERFSPDPSIPRERRIVSVGRITRVKHYDLVLRAFAALPPAYRLVIAGGAFTPADRAEYDRLRALIHTLGIADRVEMGWRHPAQMPDLLRRSDLLLHACAGGLDKALLEAMACGCLVVTTSQAARGELPDLCLANAEYFADHARRLLMLPESEQEQLRRDLRALVLERHALPRLINRLITGMQD